MTPRGIIILEGADCTGKTTLARHLVAERGAVYLHHGYHPGADWGRRYLASLRRAEREAERGRLVVLDRCYLSADAYGTVYRGRSDVPRRGRTLHRLALRASALTVLCCPSVAGTVARHRRLREERGERYRDISGVAAWFDRLVWGTGGPSDRACYGALLAERPANPFRAHSCLYDLETHGRDLAGYATRLLDRLAELRADRLAFLPPSSQNWAGHSATARVLLVGERPGHGLPSGQWPFVAPSEAAGCAGWFAEQLNRAGVYEEHLAWTNAYATPADTVTSAVVPQLLDGRRWDAVVALGAVAARCLRSLGCAGVIELDHPQHQKRFHHSAPGYLDPLLPFTQLHPET